MFKQNITNPFVGLRAFEADEYNLFFGRKTQIQEIIENLNQTNFSAVLGYSGSGKSSLIKSGIIPTLKKNTYEEWKIGICTPGYSPTKNLAKALIDIYPESNKTSEKRIDDITDILSEENSSLSNTLLKLNKNHSGNCLLIIDQFEELFSLSKSEDFKKSAHFVSLLLEAIKNKADNIYIILTLRSDFIGNCTEFTGLPEALNKSQYLIPRLSSKQFNEVINGPLGEVNYKISDDLLEILINDITNNQDQLPILQHAMMRTIEYWKSHSSPNESIDIHHYKSIGTMKKALSNHADEAYNELNETEKEGCKKMFKVLVNFENLNITRNPMEFGKIVKITAVEPAVLINIINTFRTSNRSFLSPIASVKIIDTTIIDISHESLLRLWNRLRVWIKEEMESFEIYKNLCETAALYQEGKGSLLTNPELQIVLKWRENQNPTKDWGLRYDHSYARAINFLEDSKTKFNQDVIFKNLAQVKRIKRNKQFTFLVSIACVLFLFLGVFSWIEKQRANSAKQEAVEAEVKAVKNEELAYIEKEKADKARLVAVKAEGQAEKSRKEAVINEELAYIEKEKADNARLVAVEAEEQAENSRKEAEKSAKSEKIEAENARQAELKAKQEEKEANRLKNLSDAIKMAFESEKSFDLKLLDKGTSEAIDSYELFAKNSIGSKRQNQIFNSLNRAYIEGKNYNSRFYKHNLGLSKLLKSPNVNVFALLDNQKKVSILNEKSNAIQRMTSISSENVSDMTFSSDGSFLIVSTSSGKLLLYNTKNYNVAVKEFTYLSGIKSIQNFVISGIEYLLISEGGNSHLINLSSNNEINTSELEKLKSSKNIVSKNGRYLASYQNEGILLYSLSIANSKLTLDAVSRIGESAGISILKFLGSNLIATGSSKGVVRVYRISDEKGVSFIKEIKNHKNVKISGIDMYQDSNETLIITSSYDNTLNVTNLSNLDDFISLKGHNGWVKDMYFDKTQKKIYSISQDSFLRYWFIDPNDILKLLNN